LLSQCAPTSDEIKRDLHIPLLQKKGFSAASCPLKWPWTYWSEAEDYLRQLDFDRLMVIQTEELSENPERVMKSVYHFLGLPESKLDSKAYKQAFNTGSNPGIKTSSDSSAALGMSYESLLPESISLLKKLLHYKRYLDHYSPIFGFNLDHYQKYLN
jgi:hypothetical protein